MNKTAIKNFAIWSRRKLISDITYKAGLLGINDKGISEPLPISTDNIQFFDIGTGKPTEIANDEIKQRKALVTRIKEKESSSDYKTAYQYVVEEVAYTWFNRLIAIRFMEVNDYLPSRVRVLSSHIQGKSEPDVVTTPYETDMEFSAYEQDRIMQLKDENKLDELFRMLFIKQCNKLNEVLPGLFEKTSDYTELLLNISFTDQEGMVHHLINDIDEEDFTEAVEIIGWLYQYYNTEPKDEVFALLKNKVKITKERIPAATQLFTPDWIVRYMVENSLGRLWVEGHPNEDLKSEWKYYLEEAEQKEDVLVELEKIREGYKNLNIEDIKIIDPAMGSGHILVYAFEVLMQIYESQGYTQRDAATSIIENNIYGLDIDDRAYQLAYFAIMMKARKYDRRFFARGVTPNIFSIKESNDINKAHLQFLGHSSNVSDRKFAVQQIESLIDLYSDAKEYGSILNVDNYNWELLNDFVDDLLFDGQLTLDNVSAKQSQTKLKEILSIGKAMEQKYDVVVTNPPYMGGSGMNSKLSGYVKKNYPDTKSDMSTVCMEKSLNMCKNTGYVSMINIPVWMFLSSYEKMRKTIVLNNTISSMIHFGRGIFGSDFGTTSFVISKKHIMNFKGIYRRLFLKQGAVDSVEQKEKWFFEDVGYHVIQQEKFSKIPGYPIAYWVSANLANTFEQKKVSDYATVTNGMFTCNNNRFLRLWHEVNITDVFLNCQSRLESEQDNRKWYPYNKGGEFRRWYGNHQYVINFKGFGKEILNYRVESGQSASFPGQNFYFSESLSWSLVSSSKFGIRYYPIGFVFDIAGSSLFVDDALKRNQILGLLASEVSFTVLGMINPTINFQAGDIRNIPVDNKIFDDSKISTLVSENIQLSKIDWDSDETSWNFKKHPLADSLRIENAFNEWQRNCNERFYKLKYNEEELNSIFIDIYGLHEELTPEIEDKDITVCRADITRDIKSFFSYAVGCMFGRYSLDQEGLAYAGGPWDSGKYSSYIPDIDNCIPITDEEYFEDDIVGRFVEFVKVVYGKETLEENLNFIAKALGSKGDSSREVIRNYFIKDFFKDHVKTYQKRPIYWLYDSGKQNGFKALIYMHRYTADTTGIVRVDYLHKMQKIYMGEIDRMQDMIENSSHARDVAQAEKRKEKLIKQLKETKEYDEKIAHIALSRIDIDLDDGVKVNYDKAQTAHDGKRLDILAKI